MKPTKTKTLAAILGAALFAERTNPELTEQELQAISQQKRLAQKQARQQLLNEHKQHKQQQQGIKTFVFDDGFVCKARSLKNANRKHNHHTAQIPKAIES